MNSQVFGIFLAFLSVSFGTDIPIIISQDTYGQTTSATCNIPKPYCNASKPYRSLDGSCNNLKNPTWGMANTAFTRIGTPDYADGIHSIRQSVASKPLPNARTLSLSYFHDLTVTDDVTLMVTHWGQVIAHDVTLSKASGVNSDCPCINANVNTDTCANIPIDFYDPLYTLTKQECLPLVRTAVTLTGNCTAGPKQQINTNTHTMDLSLTYGSSKADSDNLRTKSGGKLITTVVDGISYPMTTSPSECTNSKVCYKAGDARINQNPDLVVLQSLLLNNHNWLCDYLAAKFPNYNDDTLFEEARAINIAQYQAITYNEFLTELLGQDGKSEFGLDTAYQYDENTLPIVINAFTAGAYRYLHSSIAKYYIMFGNLRLPNNVFKFIDWINRPDIVLEGNMETILLGLTVQPMEKLDIWYSSDINGYFPSDGVKPGIDLSAFDIQRGRDHGIPTYVELVKICTGIEVTKFDDLLPFIDLIKIAKLKMHYKAVQDVDAFVGVNFEGGYGDSKLGPVALCVIGEQFRRLRTGDRYFYENIERPNPLTSAQLAVLQKISLAYLICTNTKITQIQRNVFKPHGLFSNQLEDCSTIISEIDLSVW